MTMTSAGEVLAYRTGRICPAEDGQQKPSLFPAFRQDSQSAEIDGRVNGVCRLFEWRWRNCDSCSADSPQAGT